MNWKQLFSYQPGTPDIIMMACGLAMFVGILIAGVAAVMHMFFSHDIGAEISLAQLLIGAGAIGHGMNNFSQGFGMNRMITPPVNSGVVQPGQPKPKIVE